jgi:hypothetical protein
MLNQDFPENHLLPLVGIIDRYWSIDRIPVNKKIRTLFNEINIFY